MEHFKELIEALGLKVKGEIIYDGKEPVTNDEGLVFQLYSKMNEFDGVYFNPIHEEAIRSDSNAFKLMKYQMNKRVTFLLTALIIKAIKALREGKKLPTALQFKATKYTERNAKDFKAVVMALGESGRTLVSFEVENNVEIKGEKYPSVGVVVNNVVDMIDKVEMKNDSKALILSAMRKLIKEGINSASMHDLYSNYDAIVTAYNATIEKLNKLLVKVDGTDSKFLLPPLPTIEVFEGNTLVERMDPYLEPGGIDRYDESEEEDEEEDEFEPIIRKPKRRPPEVRRKAKKRVRRAYEDEREYERESYDRPEPREPRDEFEGIKFPPEIKTRAQKLYYLEEMRMRDPRATMAAGSPPGYGGTSQGAPHVDPASMSVAERLAYKRRYGVDPVPPERPTYGNYGGYPHADPYAGWGRANTAPDPYTSYTTPPDPYATGWDRGNQPTYPPDPYAAGWSAPVDPYASYR